jgi:neutral ceramidase
MPPRVPVSTDRHMKDNLHAGAAVADITPIGSPFLYGYPFVPRYSTGVHDPLLSSALFLADGRGQAMFIGNDIIWVSKETVRRVRERISAATSIPAQNIMVTASHTHSGPMTLDFVANEADKVVPKTDQGYVSFLEDQIVSAAVRAHGAAEPAEVGLSVVKVTGIGANRRDPDGPSDPNVPVMLVRSAFDKRPRACMLVCSMHPTVLHEDSPLISGDFPGLARLRLQQSFLGEDCPVLHHTGPSGNQSPRHVTRANNFDEAARLGGILAEAVALVLPKMEFSDSLTVDCLQDFAVLPRRAMPSVAEARLGRDRAAAKLEHLRSSGAPRQLIRTAEVDWFGAEETLTLAEASTEGRLDRVYASVLPAEIQVIRIGSWAFVGWPGEIFVEYALAVKACAPDTWVISLANGELQGYIVTPSAVAEGAYEAANSLFAVESGDVLVEHTLALLAALGSAGDSRAVG